MNQSEIEAAVVAKVTSEGKIEYAKLMRAFPDISPERVAYATWALRASNKVKFVLASQPGGKPLHTVEVL